MECEVRYKPSFAAIFVTLSPGEKITAEAGAMTSMDGQLTMKTQFSGGFFSGLLKKFLGGESLFVNVFENETNQALQLVLTQSMIGDIISVNLNGNSICFQPGAYIANDPGVNIGVRWAGFSSWFAGEGLFKLQLSGHGKVFFGAYGGITKKHLNGELVVDNGHLVAYDTAMKMKIGMAGGLIASITSGEGLINRIRGNGDIYLQSRSVDGLVKFLTTKIR